MKSEAENTSRKATDAASPQHSDEAGTGIRPSPDPEVVEQDPGEQQKRNQGGEKEDPLAA